MPRSQVRLNSSSLVGVIRKVTMRWLCIAATSDIFFEHRWEEINYLGMSSIFFLKKGNDMFER